MLKESIRIRNLELKNRLVMPPMATSKSTKNGLVTDELCAYYRARVQSGAIGLVITEHSYVCLQGQANENQLSLGENADMDGLKKLISVFRESGTPVIAQINHSGSAALPSITGMEPVGPSAVPNPRRKNGIVPHALTVPEILEIEELFTAAALRAKEAGYDGVEIHAAHSYLLNQFYSPLSNHREDLYGSQNLENRTRILVETLQKVRKAVGENYPIAVRLGGCDYMEGGSTIEDAVGACRIIEKAGADLIDLSGGMCSYVRADHTEPGYFGDMTAAVKKQAAVPVLLTGGITTGAEAEALLLAGAADLIGVGRALFKDADWAAKAL